MNMVVVDTLVYFAGIAGMCCWIARAAPSGEQAVWHRVRLIVVWWCVWSFLYWYWFAGNSRDTGI